MTFQTLDEETKISMKQNLDAVKEQIRAAKERAGVTKDITLLAATKTVPAEVINYAVHTLGITDIGENRVQELLSKYDALDKNNVRLHFIGKLQTNKVKYIVDKVDMIHSLDNLRLAEEINNRCAKIGKIMDVLVEVNSGREAEKSGVMPEEVDGFIENLRKYDNIRVKGLMTIAPVCSEKEGYRKYFRETYEIFIDNLQKKSHNIDIQWLSMGMSASFETAIEEGTDIVRIGSAIFGARY